LFEVLINGPSPLDQNRRTRLHSHDRFAWLATRRGRRVLARHSAGRQRRLHNYTWVFT